MGLWNIEFCGVSIQTLIGLTWKYLKKFYFQSVVKWLGKTLVKIEIILLKTQRSILYKKKINRGVLLVCFFVSNYHKCVYNKFVKNEVMVFNQNYTLKYLLYVFYISNNIYRFKSLNGFSNLFTTWLFLYNKLKCLN